ncbi:unnamed protein product [Echinostoma caproni]|uniref:Reverse transcriptase domain-containing protein n=1 Tax=Echinostoma caproni TaxID=27848 RepID=A0A183A1H7_9TREM|nr:unnamed protein product [Echinostoma caproni]
MWDQIQNAGLCNGFGQFRCSIYPPIKRCDHAIFLDDAAQVEAVSKEEAFELLRTVQTTCSVGPDGLSSSLLRYEAYSLSEIFK